MLKKELKYKIYSIVEPQDIGCSTTDFILYIYMHPYGRILQYPHILIQQL